jgi:hypothetical protein
MAAPIDPCSHCPHNGGVPQAATMSSFSTVYQHNQGISAFTKNGQLVMSSNRPTVAWSLPVRKLEEWITTLEVLSEGGALGPHKATVKELLCQLHAAHGKHREQHAEVVTDAPTGDDQLAYLAAYAASISGGEV